MSKNRFRPKISSRSGFEGIFNFDERSRCTNFALPRSLSLQLRICDISVTGIRSPDIQFIGLNSSVGKIVWWRFVAAGSPVILIFKFLPPQTTATDFRLFSESRNHMPIAESFWIFFLIVTGEASMLLANSPVRRSAARPRLILV